MKVLYYAATTVAVIFFAYVVGLHIGNIKCDARMTNSNFEHVVLNTKIMEDTNETVLHTGVRDIRSILYERYTIAE